MFADVIFSCSLQTLKQDKLVAGFSNVVQTLIIVTTGYIIFCNATVFFSFSTNVILLH